MDSTGKAVMSSADAYRNIDDGCSRAISACIDMMDAAAVLGVVAELHAVRDAILRLHAVSTLSMDGANEASWH